MSTLIEKLDFLHIFAQRWWSSGPMGLMLLPATISSSRGHPESGRPPSILLNFSPWWGSESSVQWALSKEIFSAVWTFLVWEGHHTPGIFHGIEGWFLGMPPVRESCAPGNETIQELWYLEGSPPENSWESECYVFPKLRLFFTSCSWRLLRQCGVGVMTWDLSPSPNPSSATHYLATPSPQLILADPGSSPTPAPTSYCYSSDQWVDTFEALTLYMAQKKQLIGFINWFYQFRSWGLNPGSCLSWAHTPPVSYIPN